MRRVVVVGPGSTGKSTLAARLGEITRLPVIELDELFWRPALAPTPQEEWAVIQRREQCLRPVDGREVGVPSR